MRSIVALVARGSPSITTPAIGGLPRPWVGPQPLRKVRELSARFVSLYSPRHSFALPNLRSSQPGSFASSGGVDSSELAMSWLGALHRYLRRYRFLHTSTASSSRGIDEVAGRIAARSRVASPTCPPRAPSHTSASNHPSCNPPSPALSSIVPASPPIWQLPHTSSFI
ncbi:hypothetical protein BU26DRAFT_220526 [Trematosphaeria pertusa]|uniref:Uncharacterized protein n=1 Tax=Trematosphaeria pertusa TaxID=390896 RepID=A0A6A6ITV1_9PLEO|nr:uncharacterized protein BU26DRAFT_220526 [Trematosphaeria pertusa]KAF2253312.1 hypothetical protein BU26DRAFT_220526 [Trematosphaeria pertusa]